MMHSVTKQNMYITVYLFSRIKVTFFVEGKKKEIKKRLSKLRGKKFKNAII